MARSVKKGPFVDDHLLAKVEAVGKRGDKRAIFTAASKAEAAAGFLHALAGQGAASEPDEAPEALAA